MLEAGGRNIQTNENNKFAKIKTYTRSHEHDKTAAKEDKI